MKLGTRVRSIALFEQLGPGLVTGAADDDPSCIATYSQAGAQFGFGLLWTMVLTYPLMTAVQLISAHIGRVTGCGLAKNMGDVLWRPFVGRTDPAQARILEGLITGVGFIGGGAILKHRGKASGTATAASLWATGALGAAVGYGLFDIAVVLSLATFLTLRCSRPLKRATHDQTEALDRT